MTKKHLDEIGSRCVHCGSFTSNSKLTVVEIDNTDYEACDECYDNHGYDDNDEDRYSGGFDSYKRH